MLPVALALSANPSRFILAENVVVKLLEDVSVSYTRCPGPNSQLRFVSDVHNRIHSP